MHFAESIWVVINSFSKIDQKKELRLVSRKVKRVVDETIRFKIKKTRYPIYDLLYNSKRWIKRSGYYVYFMKDHNILQYQMINIIANNYYMVVCKGLKMVNLNLLDVNVLDFVCNNWIVSKISLLKYASYKGDLKFVKFLLEHGQLCRADLIELNLSDCTLKLTDLKDVIVDALKEAIWSENIDVVKILYNQGITFNDLKKNNNLCKIMSFSSEPLDIMKFFIEKGVTLDDLRGYNYAIMNACRFGKLENIEYLCDLGLTMEDLSANNYEALMEACEYNNLDVIIFLCQNYPALDYIKINEAIQLASINGHLETVRFFYNQGITLENLKKNAKWNPGKFISGNSKIMKFWIDQGLTLEDLRANNNEVIIKTFIKGDMEIINTIIEMGITTADLKVNNYDLIEKVCENGKLEILQIMCNCGITLDDLKDSYNDFIYTAAKKKYRKEILENMIVNRLWCLLKEGRKNFFYVAAKNGHLKVIKFLFNLGLTMDDIAARQYDAVFVAARRGHLKLLKFFLNQRNLKEHFGEIIQNASQKGQLKTVKFILNQGATIDDIKSSNNVAINLATKYGHLNVLKFLYQFYTADGLTSISINSIDHALKKGYLDVVEFWFDKDIADKKKVINRSMFHNACKKGYLEMVEFLYKHDITKLAMKTECENKCAIMKALKGIHPNYEIVDFLRKIIGKNDF